MTWQILMTTPPDDPMARLNSLAHHTNTNGNPFAAPQQNAPQPTPQQNAPQQNAPQQNAPQQNAPQQNAPQQNVPQPTLQQNAPQPAPQQGTTPPPRFGSRFGNNANTQNQQQNNNNQQQQNNNNSPLRRFGNRPPFGNSQQLSWEILPTHKTVVRFDLRGLGDPFYRLLDQGINPEFGDSRAVTKTLEEGGEIVEEMRDLLDMAWASYDFQGAIMVYNLNAKSWKSIASPAIMPNSTANNEDYFDDNDNSNNQNQQQNTPPPAPIFTCLRAIDMQVVINVLARARSQILLANAPLVFSQQYLNRSLVSDDPRLVALVRATGCLEEG